MPASAAVILPLLLMPPLKFKNLKVSSGPKPVPPTKMPRAPVEIVPLLVIPPEKLENVMVALEWFSMPPAKMAVPAPAIRPLLLMPPEKAATVPEPPKSALPSTMPRNADIVPVLVMPPMKVDFGKCADAIFTLGGGDGDVAGVGNAAVERGNGEYCDAALEG